MTPLHPRIRRLLRDVGPVVVPPPPRSMVERILAIARARPLVTPATNPEPFLLAAAVLAMAVLVAGIVLSGLPGHGPFNGPDFIEASQFAFSKLLP